MIEPKWMLDTLTWKIACIANNVEEQRECTTFAEDTYHASGKCMFKHGSWCGCDNIRKFEMMVNNIDPKHSTQEDVVCLKK